MLRMRIAAVTLVTLLAACGSSPKTQFYTLDPVPPQSRAAAPAGAPVQVAAVHIPTALDRQEMVRETAPHQLEVSDQNRWGASLDDLTQRVLTQDLAQRLPTGMLVLPQEASPRPADAIAVDILQFQRQADGMVTFDGSWSLTQRGSDKAILSRHFHRSETTASGSYTDQAAAMSRILGALADDIAGGLALADRGSPHGQTAVAPRAQRSSP